MSLGQLALVEALQHLDEHEDGHPHVGQIVELYLNYGAPGTHRYHNAAWCVGAVNRWYGLVNNDKIPWDFTLSCGALRKQFVARGWWRDPKVYDPQPGDICWWTWKANPASADHVSLYAQTLDDRHILTVGGDELDGNGVYGVRKQPRPVRCLIGYGHVEVTR